MISGLLKKIFGSRNDRLVRQYSQTVRAINALEPEIEKLSDEALKAKTDEFRKRLADGASLDDLLVEAFAVVREAGRRVHGMRHFDMQMIGGMVLHNGKIAEMRTGEGKTLTATLPVYLNALSGKGVHVITVNDYLASRDAEWMGRIYRFLGLSVGVNLSQMPHAAKQEAYAADITYGTNNEFGFDYLRDNMALSRGEQVQRGFNYCIIDEVDSILIDEARTPLIISGQVTDAAKLYYRFAAVVRALKRDVDYEVDEEKRQVSPLEPGIEKVEKALGVENLYDDPTANFVHQLTVALKAKELYHRDKDYLVSQGQVKIVDEFTGRVLEGRRWSEGLHQAVEAKEGVRIKEENQTLATVTLQNYFRMYDKLGGMTGTAVTEAAEFMSTYGLQVVPIPTNKPLARADEGDLIFRGEKGKFSAVADDIEERIATGQPVLVGTVSVEKSEVLSRELEKRGIAHEVLNAKQHTREADVVAQAGRIGGVTVATNMAGRGVDIILGGNPEGLADRDLAGEGLAHPDPLRFGMSEHEVVERDVHIHEKTGLQPERQFHIGQAPGGSGIVENGSQVGGIGHQSEELPAGAVPDQVVLRLRKAGFERFQDRRHVELPPILEGSLAILDRSVERIADAPVVESDHTETVFSQIFCKRRIERTFYAGCRSHHDGSFGCAFGYKEGGSQFSVVSTADRRVFCRYS